MISEFQLAPVLILSFDRTEDEIFDIATSLQLEEAAVTDLERIKKGEVWEETITSDAVNKIIRIPIIIDDALLPMHHVGSSTSTVKTVTYPDNTSAPIITNSTNRVSVRIELKSSLGKLSAASDIWHAIQEKTNDLFSSIARASFFGSTICIFNGYLTSIVRQTVDGTDREVLNLSFERASAVTEPAQPKEAAPVSPTATPLVPAAPPESPSILEVQSQANANAGGSTGGRLFLWYSLGTREDILARPLPQYTEIEAVARVLPIIHKVETLDFSGTLRSAITIEYDEVYIPLSLNNHNPYYMAKTPSYGYAVSEVEGIIYLGLESNDS